MRIKKIHIQNFKSLVDFELNDLKPFCAFVGPNASGKSNIFEALEFTNYVTRIPFEAVKFFGGMANIFSYEPKMISSMGFRYDFFDEIKIEFGIGGRDNLNGKNVNNEYYTIFGLHNLSVLDIGNKFLRKEYIQSLKNYSEYENDYEIFIDNFSRVFINNKSLVRLIIPSNTKLEPDASNVANILANIFTNEEKKEDFLEWVRILIPEFEDIKFELNSDKSYDLFVYEKSSKKPFPEGLLSDGTKNILALMAAVYQADSPQFLCIEEPENGLHPQAIKLLVDFFRDKCEEYGHHIWLNTHSPTLIRCLKLSEVIVVNKINGRTVAKQSTGKDDLDIKADEAWLTNALGGGTL